MNQNGSLCARSANICAPAVAFDSSGNLYAANWGNNTIEKFDSAGNGTVFANSGLSGPTFIAVQLTAATPTPTPIPTPTPTPTPTPKPHPHIH
jgi:hypothetical protein